MFTRQLRNLFSNLGRVVVMSNSTTRVTIGIRKTGTLETYLKIVVQQSVSRHYTANIKGRMSHALPEDYHPGILFEFRLERLNTQITLDVLLTNSVFLETNIRNIFPPRILSKKKCNRFKISLMLLNLAIQHTFHTSTNCPK